MMNSTLTTPPAPIAPAALADALALLKAVEDPKTTRDRLTQLAAVTTAANEQLKALADKEADLARREQAVVTAAVKNEEWHGELQRRHESVQRKENAVADLERETAAKLRDREINVAAREQGLAEREKSFAELRQKVTGAFGD